MIRALCVALLLANLGYFAWHAWIVPPQAASPQPARSAAPLLLAREAPAPAPVVPPAVIDGASKCLSIGPFVDIAEAAKAGSALRANGYAPRQRALEGTVWAGYWVALEQVPSVKDADAIVMRLRKSGIADSYIMPAAASTGVTISLGLFTERHRALTRIDEVKALGLDPRLNARQRTGTVYWIDLDGEGDPGRLDLARLEGDTGRILRLEIKACEEVDGSTALQPEPVVDLADR